MFHPHPGDVPGGKFNDAYFAVIRAEGQVFAVETQIDLAGSMHLRPTNPPSAPCTDLIEDVLFVLSQRE